MAPFPSVRNGSGNVPVTNWDNHNALIKQGRAAQSLAHASKRTIAKYADQTFTGPIKAVTQEIARRKSLKLKDETTEFLGIHLKILTQYRDMALDRIGATSFAKPEPKQPEDPLTAKVTLRLWGEMAMEVGAEQFGNARRKLVPFLKNTALPAARKTLGPYVETATNFIGRETASFAKEIRLLINDTKKDFGIAVKTETRSIKRGIGNTVNMPVSFNTVAWSTVAVVGLTASLTLANAFSSASDQQTIEPDTKEPISSVQADIPKPREYKAIQTSPNYNYPAFATGKVDYFGPKYSLASSPRSKKSYSPQSPYSIDMETIRLVSDVARENGLSRRYAATVAIIESRGNSEVCYENSKSNACGVYQFIPSTAKRYGLSDRFDPVASSEAFVEFTEDNREILQDALGRRPTDAEKYIAHQQGAAGAVALMSNPNERAIDVLYPVYLKQVQSEWKARSIARKAIINNGGSSDMTAGEFVNLLISKYERISSKHAGMFPS